MDCTVSLWATTESWKNVFGMLESPGKVWNLSAREWEPCKIDVKKQPMGVILS